MDKNEVIVSTMIHYLSRNDWKQVKPDSWQEVESIADGLCILSAEISAYAGARGANGCGDSGHDEALEAAKKIRLKIRKILGFTH